MGCHGWVRDAQVGYQIERQTLSRCKSRQRAVRMRNGISAGKALDQANLRSRIPEHRPLGAQPARRYHAEPRAGLPRNLSFDWLGRFAPILQVILGLGLRFLILARKWQVTCSARAAQGGWGQDWRRP